MSACCMIRFRSASLMFPSTIVCQYICSKKRGLLVLPLTVRVKSFPSAVPQSIRLDNLAHPCDGPKCLQTRVEACVGQGLSVGYSPPM